MPVDVTSSPFAQVLVDLAAEGRLTLTLSQLRTVLTDPQPYQRALRLWRDFERQFQERLVELWEMDGVFGRDLSDSDALSILEGFSTDHLTVCNENQMAPVEVSEESMSFAVSVPPLPRHRELARRVAGPEREVRFLLASPARVELALTSLHTKAVADAPIDTEAEEPLAAVVADVDSDAAVVWVDNLLRAAVSHNASDIHLVPVEVNRWEVKLRIDGYLRDYPPPHPSIARQAISRLMFLSSLDATKMELQALDGGFTLPSNTGRVIKGRLSSVPVEVAAGRGSNITLPRVVIRVLDPLSISRPLDSMGFAPDTLEVFRRLARQRQGAVIISGPTGSGKTTTLYSLLSEIADGERTILTVEDPVEYQLRNISQTQVSRSERGAVGFADLLRALLRQDPDVMMVGEIRDEETAKTAADAAITGHLVFSTIHTSSAPEVYTRLTQLGVPAYAVAQALSATSAQRLLRQVCGDCVERREPTPEDLVTIHATQRRHPGLDTPQVVSVAVGCDSCRGSGYRGRLAFAELLVSDAGLQEMVLHERSAAELAAYGRSNLGYRTLAEDAWRHVLSGATTLDEYLRNTLTVGRG